MMPPGAGTNQMPINLLKLVDVQLDIELVATRLYMRQLSREGGI